MVSEAMMKTILSLTLALGVCGLAGATDDKSADPVGKWNCEYEIGGQQRTSTLEIKKEGDKFVGTMSWPEQKDEKIKDPKFKDGKLTFSAVRKIMDNEIPIDYTLTIDGDEFKGKGEAELGAKSMSSTSRVSARRRTSRSRAVLRVPTADGQGGPRYRPFYAPEMRGPRCTRRSDRPRLVGP
jgi:hypothetical protein